VTREHPRGRISDLPDAPLAHRAMPGMMKP
jgi:hypothetical protein